MKMTLGKVYDELYGMIEDLKKKIQAAEKSDVTITPALESGTKIADYEIDGSEGSIYAPTVTNYEWVKLDDYTSSTINADIPSDALELRVIVYAESTTGAYFGHVFDFLKEALTETSVVYVSGSYRTSGDYTSIALDVSSTKIASALVTYLGAAKTPFTTVYYKRIATNTRTAKKKK